MSLKNKAHEHAAHQFVKAGRNFAFASGNSGGIEWMYHRLTGELVIYGRGDHARRLLKVLEQGK